MTLRKTLFTALPLILASFFALSPAFANGIAGNWKRPDGSSVKIWQCGPGNTLLCAQSGETRMFNGLANVENEKNIWAGDMKHPDMPAFMTLNGTVRFTGDKVKVQGCIVGNSMCQSESWKK